MLIAVFSDSHDHLDRIDQALGILEERGIKNGIHLGDFCAPFAMERIAQSGFPWKCVWGNVDGDRLQSYRKVEDYRTIDIADEDFRELEVFGRSIFITHYPDIARIAALSGKYDAVFHGHTHIASQEYTERDGKQTLIANPGELCGARYGEPSFGIYNTETNEFERVRL